MNEAIKDEFEIRKEKLEKLNSAGIQDYPDKFKKTHSSKDALAEKEGTKNICIAGRIITKRTMGKISFAHILDDFGKIQLVFKDDEVGESEYKIFNDLGNLNCIPRKTFKIDSIPNGVPYNLISHFIRGYFDGDGSVNFNKDKSLIFQIVGQEEFLIKNKNSNRRRNEN